MAHESRGWGLAAVLGLAAAGGNLLGGYFVVYHHWERKFLQYFLALGAGYMLAVAFLEVIPESVRLAGDAAFLYVLIWFFLDSFIRTHHCAAFSFWRRDALRRSEPPSRAHDAAGGAGDSHVF